MCGWICVSLWSCFFENQLLQFGVLVTPTALTLTLVAVLKPGWVWNHAMWREINKEVNLHLVELVVDGIIDFKPSCVVASVLNWGRKNEITFSILDLLCCCFLRICITPRCMIFISSYWANQWRYVSCIFQTRFDASCVCPKPVWSSSLHSERISESV